MTGIMSSCLLWLQKEEESFEFEAEEASDARLDVDQLLTRLQTSASCPRRRAANLPFVVHLWLHPQVIRTPATGRAQLDRAVTSLTSANIWAGGPGRVWNRQKPPPAPLTAQFN